MVINKFNLSFCPLVISTELFSWLNWKLWFSRVTRLSFQSTMQLLKSCNFSQQYFHLSLCTNTQCETNLRKLKIPKEHDSINVLSFLHLSLLTLLWNNHLKVLDVWHDNQNQTKVEKKNSILAGNRTPREPGSGRGSKQDKAQMTIYLHNFGLWEWRPYLHGRPFQY